MKKIIILTALLPLLIFGGQSFIDYRLDLKNADCIDQSRPCKKYKTKDGTIITVQGDVLHAITKSGVKIKKFKNDKKEITYPDGTKAVRDYDHTVTIYHENGKKKVISMDGKTPWGSIIKKHRKVLRRRYFVAEIIYSPYYSDEHMNKYTRKYFLELERQLYRWMYNNRLPSYKLALVISNCRHCKTGFCRRKNVQEVAVIAFRNNKKHKIFRFKYTDLLSKNAFISLAQKTVSALVK